MHVFGLQFRMYWITIENSECTGVFVYARRTDLITCNGSANCARDMKHTHDPGSAGLHAGLWPMGGMWQ